MSPRGRQKQPSAVRNHATDITPPGCLADVPLIEWRRIQVRLAVQSLIGMVMSCLPAASASVARSAASVVSTSFPETTALSMTNHYDLGRVGGRKQLGDSAYSVGSSCARQLRAAGKPSGLEAPGNITPAPPPLLLSAW